MEGIRPARQSPRIENRVIQWYEGDEFEIVFELALSDADGEAITLNESDTVTVEVRNQWGGIIKEFIFNPVQNNCITLVFDKETTALFAKGSYFYDIRLEGSYRTTIVNDNRMIVE